jgi:squalene monooxygenase
MPLILDSPSGSESSFEQRKSGPQEERRRIHHTGDVVIVGAGVLGSALAKGFGDQGRSVILLEKSLKEPDRIVGELLQPGGVQALRELGMEDCVEDIDAIRVKGMSVQFYDEIIQIPYPAAKPITRSRSNSRKEDTPSKPQGRSFHHGRFVAKLRAAAMRHPNVTVFETEATSVITCDDSNQVLGVQAITRKTQQDYFFADLTIICDGYASKFRKSYTHHTPKVKSKFWGMELKDCPLPFPEHGFVSLADRPPALLYQIATHDTRVLVDIPDNAPTASVAAGGVKNHLRSVVCPTLPTDIQPSFLAALEAPGALRSMPNSFLPPTTNRTPGLALLGDALNMRHPLTGGGMTVALNDVVLLTTLLHPSQVPDLADTKLVLRQFKTFHWRRKNLTSVINILAQALYSLFAANKPELKYLQRGCFRYFQLGGACIEEPAGLLGGIIRRPIVLVYHFFAVALLSIWVLYKEGGLLWFPWSFVMGLRVFWEAVVVIGPYILAEMKS